ncbi:hypothetical protein Agabi119p4_139 [Agaricus bisporus var. burnettii]|uniref:Rab-GAP TBC domain-containing protein n=1 Tax=Agaricus bisporus var. burnettii TaxID=192524 RepID=A0A8H7FA53_AGABI|nr:hypothetical protein Agabi119p4_139 [Agaricus bisporus var. burnettii]
MNAPAVLLVPPTPLNLGFEQRDPSPSSTTGTAYSTESSTTSSSSPPETMFTTVDHQRTSSETSIFSIYSMYGDNHRRTSWVPPKCAVSNGRVSKELPTLSPIVDCRDSGLSLTEEWGLAYNDPPHAIDLTDALHPGSVPLRSTLRASRLVSPHSPPSEQLEDHRTLAHALAPPNGRPGESRSLSPGLSQLPGDTSRTRSTTPQSRRSSPIPFPSHSRQSTASIRELPPLPPSTRTTPPSTPPSNLFRPTSSPFLSPKPSVWSPGNLQSNASSPSSRVSLVPSEGEDGDSFHVRRTYAILEVSGVKGDGYEEGVERTRARLGSNRQDQMEEEEMIEQSKDLSPEEIKILSSVDRYGFFTIPSHDRLIRLTAAPLTKRFSPVSAGPPSVSANATSLKSLPPSRHSPKETSRISKWTRMLQPASRDSGGNIQTWRIKASKESKLRERVYKGIPDRWRATAWDLLMCRFTGMSYNELVRLGEEYRDGVDKPSPYDVQIDLDVPRTISGHIMFRTRYGAGQRSLFHVLHSFSLRCPTCGYVQGMGPIAASLLCYLEPERVYACLIRLHDAYNMHAVFSPGFPGLLEAIYLQERIMEQMMPDVYQAFKKHMISTTSYATKWYITLFANSVPFQTQLRLWDAFLLEGYDLFVAVAVAIVWVYRDHITSSSASFETILSLLSSFFVPEDEDLFLTWLSKTLGDKRLRNSMRQWRADWKKLVAQGKDGSALL